MYFEIIGEIEQKGTIAIGKSIREISRLRRVYGDGKWRKLRGITRIRLGDKSICTAEIHWYEAHGIGKKEFKIKRIIE